MIEQLLRENIKNLKAYRSARDENFGMDAIFLDANESPFETGLNRYPDPNQNVLKAALSDLRQCSSNQIVLGNGSDEIIDLLFRSFCNPGKDNIICANPSYGMFQVCADINQVELRKFSLDQNFNFKDEDVLSLADENSKLLLLCSPNNPTGNIIPLSTVQNLCNEFRGIVVVDEAYIDFAETPSAIALLNQNENLFVMQTFSKSWGMAGIRLGVGYSSEAITAVLNTVKAPYNVNTLTQNLALKAIENKQQSDAWIKAQVEQRKVLERVLAEYEMVEKVFPSEANFLLVRFMDAQSVFNKLLENEIVVRDRSNELNCENCLRISIGTMEENVKLLEVLKTMES